MDREEVLKKLESGDLIAYSPDSFFGWLISVKTWHSISHVETYIGNGQSVGSRIKDGVKVYPVYLDNVYGIYRPNKSFSIGNAMEWFAKEANGQQYDWKGIFGFIKVVKGGDRSKMFCSEFCTRFYRNGGLELFSTKEDADRIAPFQLTISPFLKEVV